MRLEFVREVDDPWTGLRVVALLNHTSLFEPVVTAIASNRLLWQIAAHGVLPVADKTLARPIVGRLFRLIARHVVRVTRQRDETWAEVLERLHDEEALIVILPEGRMKRRTGLDLDGNPMTIRGGIADILESVPDGRLFIGYSGGLHHVHAPGDRFPRLFRRVGDHQLVAVLAGLGQDPILRVDHAGGVMEPADVPGRLDAGTVGGADEHVIGDGGGGLLQLPQTTCADRPAARIGAQGRSRKGLTTRRPSMIWPSWRSSLNRISAPELSAVSTIRESQYDRRDTRLRRTAARTSPGWRVSTWSSQSASTARLAASADNGTASFRVTVT